MLDRLLETSSEILGSLGPAAQAAIPTLLKGLKSEYWNVEEFSGKALAGIGVPAIPALIGCLKDEKIGTRMMAAKALGEIGPAAKIAIPALKKSLKNTKGMNNSNYEQTIKDALIQIGKQK